MKLILLIIILLPLIALSTESHTYNFTILRVIDGDTVVFAAPFMPDPLPKELSLRIYGVDTPEKGFRSHCISESNAGISASEYTKNIIANSTKREITILHWDKYGGRVLGDVLLNGVSLRSLLLQNGYAKPYFGGTKDSWCIKKP